MFHQTDKSWRDYRAPNQNWSHQPTLVVTVRLYTVMLEVCRWLTNEKQRKTDIRLTVQ